MFKRAALTGIIALSVLSCYAPQRDCARFREGNFKFTTTIDGVAATTTFFRNDTMEIDRFQGKIDTSSVRWINDCEYIVKKINPKNASEEKSVHIKILSTTDTSYTFEYNLVGQSKKSRGTAHKTN